MSKAIFGALSAVLLVAAVIGVVATVVSTNHKADASEGDGSLSTTSKSVSTFCAKTDYQADCERTIGSAINGSSSPKEVIQASFQAAIDEIQAGFHLSNNVSLKANDPMNKAAFNICRQLLEDADEELNAAFSETHDLQGLARRTDDIKTWLSAVISYQQTCLDGITDPELQSTMKDGLSTAAKVTSNAIAIVDELSSLLKSFKVPINITMDEQGFPSWFSSHDRKLLAAQSRGQLTPNVVVAKDGSGKFTTINDAINSMPKDYSGRYVIYVKAGVYKENVIVGKDKVNVLMYGDGSRKTIVTGSKNYVDGVQTVDTATFAALGQGFIAKSMGFSNTAGPEKHQAVALRVQSDMAAFFNCRMDAYQDTLYVQAHRQFYRNCVVSGTVDFIFGDSSTVLQNCLLVMRRPMDNQQNIVTAHGRAEAKETTALVIQNCRIVPEKALFPDRLKFRNYLGRPWKAYSRTIVMESTIGDLIQPEGWMPWDGDNFLDTLYYAEYNNRGPGAGTSGRVNWPGYHVIGRAEAQKYTVDSLIQGSQWIKYSNIRYFGGLKF
ncbi:pectinesterase [Musa troglodytarum]|uniref:Pectinesterase n=2 Tax=Musa troglodytarum TaxID=320322 RepID=A0A9E7GW74_9LILI|nr:pectinesterase [Musa troglodytarum]